jgi:hypothetical protein
MINLAHCNHDCNTLLHMFVKVVSTTTHDCDGDDDVDEDVHAVVLAEMTSL